MIILSKFLQSLTVQDSQFSGSQQNKKLYFTAADHKCDCSFKKLVWHMAKSSPDWTSHTTRCSLTSQNLCSSHPLQIWDVPTTVTYLHCTIVNWDPIQFLAHPSLLVTLWWDWWEVMPSLIVSLMYCCASSTANAGYPDCLRPWCMMHNAPQDDEGTVFLSTHNKFCAFMQHGWLWWWAGMANSMYIRVAYSLPVLSVLNACWVRRATSLICIVRYFVSLSESEPQPAGHICDCSLTYYATHTLLQKWIKLFCILNHTSWTLQIVHSHWPTYSLIKYIFYLFAGQAIQWAVSF